MSELRPKWGKERKFTAETARLRWRYNQEFRELEAKIEKISESLKWGDEHVLRKGTTNFFHENFDFVLDFCRTFYYLNDFLYGELHLSLVIKKIECSQMFTFLEISWTS